MRGAHLAQRFDPVPVSQHDIGQQRIIAVLHQHGVAAGDAFAMIDRIGFRLERGLDDHRDACIVLDQQDPVAHGVVDPSAGLVMGR